MTISAILGEPRYIEALPFTITTISQKAGIYAPPAAEGPNKRQIRSEEHTSELQSRGHLVCRLLLEKKKKTTKNHTTIYSYVNLQSIIILQLYNNSHIH